MKYQLLMVFRLQNSIRQLPALNSKAVEIYCNGFLGLLDDERASEEAFRKAAALLETVRDKMAPSRDPPERTRAFTALLIGAASGGRHEPPAAVAMVGGTVKWFSDIMGYGFIAADDGSDVFVHLSVLPRDSRSLVTGQRIQFATAQTSRGLRVAQIRYS